MSRWIAPLDHYSELEFFRAYIKPGDTVVDVGANVGETVLIESLAVGCAGRRYRLRTAPENLQISEAQPGTKRRQECRGSQSRPRAKNGNRIVFR